MRIISKIAGVWLLAVGFFVWGVVAIEYQFWPGEKVSELNIKIRDFILGHPDEPVTSPKQKLESDSGGIPYRFLVKEVPLLEVPTGATAFSHYEDGFLVEGYHAGELDGYVLIAGAFNIGKGYNKAAVLFSASGEYIRHWRLKRVGVGIAIDEKTTSLLVNNGLQKVDWCEDEAKESPSLYKSQHHSIEIAPDGTYWTHEGYRFIQLDPNRMTTERNLEVIDSIDILEDLVPINSEISPLTARFTMTWDLEMDPYKNQPIIGLLEDPFHNNDIQPFVDDRFPTSAGYALLASIREQNLILVIDPTTKKILWYRQGLTERQHDVDYFSGSLYVYDNGPFRGYSRIVRMEFDELGDGTYGLREVIDGSRFDWFDPSRGQHDIFFSRGKRYHVIANDRRGKVYIFDEYHNPVFALQNFLEKKQGSNVGIQLRSALYVPFDQFERLQGGCQ